MRRGYHKGARAWKVWHTLIQDKKYVSRTRTRTLDQLTKGRRGKKTHFWSLGRKEEKHGRVPGGGGGSYSSERQSTDGGVAGKKGGKVTMFNQKIDGAGATWERM